MLLTADQIIPTHSGPTPTPTSGISTGRHFESIKLNSDHTKLIFRGPSPNSTTTTSTSTTTKTSSKKGGKKRGQTPGGVEGDGDMSEAYCYIVWGGQEDKEGAGVGGEGSSRGKEKDKHHAVVQSDDESFRQVVLQAMQGNL